MYLYVPQKQCYNLFLCYTTGVSWNHLLYNCGIMDTILSTSFYFWTTVVLWKKCYILFHLLHTCGIMNTILSTSSYCWTTATLWKQCYILFLLYRYWIMKIMPSISWFCCTIIISPNDATDISFMAWLINRWKFCHLS